MPGAGQSGSARRLSAITDDCDGPVRAAPGKRRRMSRALKGRNKVRRGQTSTDRRRSMGAGVSSSRGGRRSHSALFRPFRARMVWGRVPRATRIGPATFFVADNRSGADPLCPGLGCGCPVGARRRLATMMRHRGCRSPRTSCRKQCACNGECSSRAPCHWLSEPRVSYHHRRSDRRAEPVRCGMWLAECHVPLAERAACVPPSPKIQPASGASGTCAASHWLRSP